MHTHQLAACLCTVVHQMEGALVVRLLEIMHCTEPEAMRRFSPFDGMQRVEKAGGQRRGAACTW